MAKIRVAQIGVGHDHASGFMDTMRRMPETYEVVGVCAESAEYEGLLRTNPCYDGIPRRDHILKEGDIVSLDAGLIYKGYHSDAARTYPVGKVSEEAQLLIDRTKQSFFEGIKMAVAGNHLYDISNRIDDYISQFGYGIVTDLVGHGIGTHLHEDPQIPNFRQKKKGIKLCAGMTLAIEPMINIGRSDVEWLDDDWTVVTEDGTYSAHYENTIAITPDGEPEILTLL